MTISTEFQLVQFDTIISGESNETFHLDQSDRNRTMSTIVFDLKQSLIRVYFLIRRSNKIIIVSCFFRLANKKSCDCEWIFIVHLLWNLSGCEWCGIVSDIFRPTNQHVLCSGPFAGNAMQKWMALAARKRYVFHLSNFHALSFGMNKTILG